MSLYISFVTARFAVLAIEISILLSYNCSQVFHQDIQAQHASLGKQALPNNPVSVFIIDFLVVIRNHIPVSLNFGCPDRTGQKREGAAMIVGQDEFELDYFIGRRLVVKNCQQTAAADINSSPRYLPVLILDFCIFWGLGSGYHGHGEVNPKVIAHLLMADSLLGDHLQDLLADHFLNHGLKGDNAPRYIEVDDAGRSGVKVTYRQGAGNKQEIEIGGSRLLKNALFTLALVLAQKRQKNSDRFGVGNGIDEIRLGGHDKNPLSVQVVGMGASIRVALLSGNPTYAFLLPCAAWKPVVELKADLFGTRCIVGRASARISKELL